MASSEEAEEGVAGGGAGVGVGLDEGADQRAVHERDEVPDGHRVERAAGPGEYLREQLDALPEGVLGTDELVELILDQLIGRESRERGLEAALLRFERLVGAGRRPYLAPLMRKMRDEFDALLGQILARSGRSLDPVAVRDLVSLIDGAVVSALIESDPDPRGVGRELLLRTL